MEAQRTLYCPRRSSHRSAESDANSHDDPYQDEYPNSHSLAFSNANTNLDPNTYCYAKTHQYYSPNSDTLSLAHSHSFPYTLAFQNPIACNSFNYTLVNQNSNAHTINSPHYRILI